MSLSSLILAEIKNRKVDWERMEQILDENIHRINEFEDDNCSLGNIYLEIPYQGKEAFELTKLFVKKGFDVKANGGKNGANCLEQLCWSYFDKYVIEIVEYLITIGANPMVVVDDREQSSALDAIDWRLGDWMTGEYDNANLYEAYYLLVDRAINGKTYKGIRAFREVVGEIVNRVEKIIYKTLWDSKEQVRYCYVFTCGEKKLVVYDYVEFIVNPYIYDEVIEIWDVTNEFQSIIGAKIRGLRYHSNSQAKMNFDNGWGLLVWDNRARGYTNDEEWLTLSKDKKMKLPALGTKLERICFSDRGTYGEEVRCYGKSLFILQFEKEAYSLYFHNNHRYGSGFIRLEQHKKTLADQIKNQVDLHDIVLKDVRYTDEAIRWVCFSCEKGVLYIKPGSFSELEIFLSPCEVENPENIGSFTQELIQIHFEQNEGA